MFKSLDGSYSYYALLNGQDISDMVTEIIITENTVIGLPVASVKITSPMSLEQELPDGSLFEIKISGAERLDLKKEYYEEVPVAFMLISYFSEMKEGHYLYSLDFIYALPDLYDYGTESFTNMAVSSMMSKISTRLGLKSEIDTTNDIQTWLRNNIPLLDFLRDCILSSYIDKSSGMIWCVTRSNTLKFKNISRIEGRQDYDWNLVGNKENKPMDIVYQSDTHEDNTGVLGMRYGGYGTRGFIHKLYEDTVETTYPAQVNTAYKNILLNQNSFKINSDASFIDVGNVHKHYYQAREQNYKVLETYSNTKIVDLKTPKNVQMFDRVNLMNFDMMTNTLDENESGSYIISGITTNINKERFERRVFLTRNGKLK